MKKILITLAAIINAFYTTAVQAEVKDAKLLGIVIGTQKAMDYDTNKSSTKVTLVPVVISRNIVSNTISIPSG